MKRRVRCEWCRKLYGPTYVQRHARGCDERPYFPDPPPRLSVRLAGIVRDTANVAFREGFGAVADFRPRP